MADRQLSAGSDRSASLYSTGAVRDISVDACHSKAPYRRFHAASRLIWIQCRLRVDGNTCAGWLMVGIQKPFCRSHGIIHQYECWSSCRCDVVGISVRLRFHPSSACSVWWTVSGRAHNFFSFTTLP